MKYDYIITWEDGTTYTFYNCNNILDAIGRIAELGRFGLIKKIERKS